MSYKFSFPLNAHCRIFTAMRLIDKSRNFTFQEVTPQKYILRSSVTRRRNVTALFSNIRRFLHLYMAAFVFFCVVVFLRFSSNVMDPSLHGRQWDILKAGVTSTTNKVGLLMENSAKTYSYGRDVAIGCAITTKNLKFIDVPHALPLFTEFLVHFCETASSAFSYHLYLSYDDTDEYFRMFYSEKVLIEVFYAILDTLSCSRRNISLSLNTVRCRHSEKPAWAQNDAMWIAYLDDHTFYYRINDDTIFLDRNWTEIFINTLIAFDPPYVGVTGPNHQGGNMKILTYDFVHKTHLDIFGFYYPRVFTKWHADDWISGIYGKNRTVKEMGIHLKHTEGLGIRYTPEKLMEDSVFSQKIKCNQERIIEWLEATNVKILTQSIGVIKAVFTMFMDDLASLHGCIHNAALVARFLPESSIQVYVVPGFNQKKDYVDKFVKKLLHMSVEVLMIEKNAIDLIPQSCVQYSSLDHGQVDFVIFRDSTGRFSLRDSHFIRNWVKSNSLFHYIRDHNYSLQHNLFPGLFGVNLNILKRMKLPGRTITAALTDYFKDNDHPKSKDASSKYCNDRISEIKFLNSFFETTLHELHYTSATNYDFSNESMVKWYGLYSDMPLNHSIHTHVIGDHFTAFSELTNHSCAYISSS